MRASLSCSCVRLSASSSCSLRVALCSSHTRSCSYTHRKNARKTKRQVTITRGVSRVFITCTRALFKADSGRICSHADQMTDTVIWSYRWVTDIKLELRRDISRCNWVRDRIRSVKPIKHVDLSRIQMSSQLIDVLRFLRGGKINKYIFRIYAGLGHIQLNHSLSDLEVNTMIGREPNWIGTVLPVEIRLESNKCHTSHLKKKKKHCFNEMQICMNINFYKYP